MNVGKSSLVKSRAWVISLSSHKIFAVLLLSLLWQGASELAHAATAGVDFIEQAVSVTGTPASGGSITLTSTTVNQGTVSAASSIVGYYLSTDGTTKGSYLGYKYVAALSPGGSTGPVTASLTMPTNLAGTYYLMACANYGNGVVESNTANNCAASAPVTVAGADLVESAVSVLSSVPTSGGTIQVSDTATNQGLGAAASSITGFYLSTNGTTKGSYLGYRQVSALSPGGSTGPVTTTVTLPAITGTYYLMACANYGSEVLETNTANNCAATLLTKGTVAPLQLTTSSLANGTAGSSYSAVIQATGGTSPYSWSVVSGSLPAGLTLSSSGTISGTPSAAGTFSFTAQVKDSESTPATATRAESIVVAAKPASAPVAGLSSSSITFSAQAVGTTSSADTATLTNTGNASLTISSIAASAGYSETNNCGATLAASAQCNIGITFTPAASGAISGVLTIQDNAGSGVQQINLYGSGVTAGALNVTPSVAFGSVADGQTSTQTVTVSNTGGESVTVSAASSSGTGFGISGLTLPLVLAAGGSSSFQVTFAPTSSGSTTGTVRLTDTGSSPTASISLTGTGTAVVSVTHQVALSWTDSSSTATGFNVYRGSVSGGPYSKITSAPVSAEAYTDSSVTAGDTYYYVVTAVSSSGQESADSAQVTAVVPAS